MRLQSDRIAISADHRMGRPKGKASPYSDMQLRSNHITISHQCKPRGGAFTLSHVRCDDTVPTMDHRMGRPKGKAFTYSDMPLRSNHIAISYRRKPRGGAFTLLRVRCDDVDPTMDHRMGRPTGKAFTYNDMRLQSDRIKI